MPTKFFTNSYNYAAQIEGLTPSELSALLSGQEPERDEIVSLESGRVVRADGAIHFDLLLASDKGRFSTVRKLVAATPDAGVYRHRVGQGRRWVRELARALDHSITPKPKPHEFLYDLLMHAKGRSIRVRHFDRGRVDVVGGVS